MHVSTGVLYGVNIFKFASALWNVMMSTLLNFYVVYIFVLTCAVLCNVHVSTDALFVCAYSDLNSVLMCIGGISFNV